MIIPIVAQNDVATAASVDVVVAAAGVDQRIQRDVARNRHVIVAPA